MIVNWIRCWSHIGQLWFCSSTCSYPWGKFPQKKVKSYSSTASTNFFGSILVKWKVTDSFIRKGYSHLIANVHNSVYLTVALLNLANRPPKTSSNDLIRETSDCLFVTCAQNNCRVMIETWLLWFDLYIFVYALKNPEDGAQIVIHFHPESRKTAEQKIHDCSFFCLTESLMVTWASSKTCCWRFAGSGTQNS